MRDIKIVILSNEQTEKPLNEPVAWYWPIVMNAEEELRTAYEELKSGDFIK